MPFCFKSSHMASSISVMSLAIGLAFGEPTTQKSLAQTTPTRINGAGSTFAERLYQSQGGWFNTYGVAVSPATNPPGPVNSRVQFNYAAVFLPQTPPPTPTEPINPLLFAFGSTDAPLTTTELQQYQQLVQPFLGSVVQVPVVATAITLAYNRQGLNLPAAGFRLSRATYCGILNGQITNWNNSRITADNGGVRVSTNLPIRVVRRSDGSGSTFILSNHLNTVCRGLSPSSLEWRQGVGKYGATAPAPSPATQDVVYWPSTFLSAQGSAGIVSTLNRTPGAIGYVDNPTRLGARPPRLPAAILQNRSGNYVAPTAAATSAALTSASDLDSSPNIITATVPNPLQATAYPIVSVSYLLFPGRVSNPIASAGIKGFIN